MECSWDERMRPRPLWKSFSLLYTLILDQAVARDWLRIMFVLRRDLA
jgi:hypothetical protein